MKKTVMIVSVAALLFALAPSAQASLVKTGDVVYDNVADLTWYDFTPPVKNWNVAGEWAVGLTVGGVSDWRLPTQAELVNLVYGDSVSGIPSPFTDAILTSDDGTNFWTSTDFAGDPTNRAVTVGNDDAFVSNDLKIASQHVVAVRTGEVPEPATMSLLAIGGLALIRRRRRS
jgi:hypothetical protein